MPGAPISSPSIPSHPPDLLFITTCWWDSQWFVLSKSNKNGRTPPRPISRGSALTCLAISPPHYDKMPESGIVANSIFFLGILPRIIARSAFSPSGLSHVIPLYPPSLLGVLTGWSDCASLTTGDSLVFREHFYFSILILRLQRRGVHQLACRTPHSVRHSNAGLDEGDWEAVRNRPECAHSWSESIATKQTRPCGEVAYNSHIQKIYMKYNMLHYI